MKTRFAKSLGVPPPEAKDAIELLTKTIEAEPLAWGARLTRANSYANLGDLDQAEKEMAAIEKGFPGFGPIYFSKALYSVKRGDGDAAVNWLNKALAMRPQLFEQIRNTFPPPILADPRIRWPSICTNSPSIH